jgi:hypothetical protein
MNRTDAKEYLRGALDDAVEGAALQIFERLRRGPLGERDKALAALDALPWLAGEFRKAIDEIGGFDGG